MAQKQEKQKRPASDNGAEEIVCGFHAVQSSLARAGADVIEVLIDRRRRDARGKQLQRDLVKAGIHFRIVAREQLERLSRGVKHQGVLARVRCSASAKSAVSGATHSPTEPNLYRLLEQLDHPPLLLILDQVQDPHNLGACLRTAAGAGADAVILPKDRACPVTPAVTRVAAGAVGKVPLFYVPNLARTLENLQQLGVWMTGGDDRAERTLYEVDFTPATAIVMGAEGSGLRRLTRQGCDQLARIPMPGGVSSLNVSVATGLFLFEALRQRRG